MSEVPERSAEEPFQRIASIVEAARGHVARSVNTALVHVTRTEYGRFPALRAGLDQQAGSA
jgi:hypothetical protein